LTLVVALGFAIVGLAAPSSAHHNTITGSVTCRTGGGWDVTWQVVNSEQRTEQITASNRPSAVPVGTTLTSWQTRSFKESVTTKPTSTVTLTLSARWSNGVTQTNSGSIPVSSFSDNCNTTKVVAPTVPVIDDCGPGNARFGTVPSGPWTSVLNPNGSLTITANPGYVFTTGQTVITYPRPTDSNQPCVAAAPQVPVVDDCGPGNAHYGTVPSGPWTSVLNPDGSLTITANPGHSFGNGQSVITLPVPTDTQQPCPVSPPEVLPAEVRVVKAQAKHIDKCGRASDLFKVSKRAGVVYKVNGKVVRQGVWLKARTLKGLGAKVARSYTVTVRAESADATYRLRGKQVWRMTFSTKPCAKAPEISPHTGS
jgi:hypothetical protein